MQENTCRQATAHQAPTRFNRAPGWPKGPPTAPPKNQPIVSHNTVSAPPPLPSGVCCTLQADILMVTDGEIAPPKQELLDDIAAAHEDMGLEVHGLLVSSQVSESMQKLCTHLHVFKSWSVVGAESWQY